MTLLNLLQQMQVPAVKDDREYLEMLPKECTAFEAGKVWGVYAKHG